MALIPILAHDAQDESLLSATNPQGRTCLPLNSPLDTINQKVFDRAIDNGWLQFIDVAPMPAPQGGIMMVRVFRITKSGQGRLNELRERKRIDATH